MTEREPRTPAERLERLDPFRYYYAAEVEERQQRARRANAWLIDAESIVCGLPAGWTGTAFNIAQYVSGNLKDPPETPPWTSLMLRLIRHNVIVRTGIFKKLPGSTRLIPVYRRQED